jgi:thiosulfate reductase cytochrome b subunit
MAKKYIYKRFERFWHWTQALLVLMLVLTGFEVHGFWELFGYEAAVDLHDIFAYALIFLVAFAIFWHFTTGEWRQYLPTRKYLKEMIRFYVAGIFKGESHPTRKTEISKLNPLQRATYLMLKIFLFPVQIVTGLVYLYYNSLQGTDYAVSLDTIAKVHTIGAYLFLIFLVIHIYLTTTGETPTSNIKAMITGWEDLEEEKSEA